MKRIAVALATGLYSGYAPIAPGTIGSAVGLVLFVPVRLLGSPAVEAMVLVALFGFGVWSASVTERHTGRSDPGIIVIDEIVGMLVTLAFVPVGWTAAVAGFLLFRGFDVVKPYPVGVLERLPGGWGVMADDVAAGIYAQLILRAGLWLLVR